MVSPPQISLTTWHHEPPKGFGKWIIHDGFSRPIWLLGHESTTIVIRRQYRDPNSYRNFVGAADEFIWSHENLDGDLMMFAVRSDHPIYPPQTNLEELQDNPLFGMF